MASFDSAPTEVEVILDGNPIPVPSERRTFAAIRSYLECAALQKQRILCWISVDGEAVNLTQHLNVAVEQFTRVEAETIGLNEVPLQLINAALLQTNTVRSRLQSAVELVLINETRCAREIWWTLSTALKEPLLTLSLVPDTACGPNSGGASLLQLRKWQLQQLGSVIQDVDEACDAEDTAALAEALEKRALRWLAGLQESLQLWHDSVSHQSPVAACHNE